MVSRRAVITFSASADGSPAAAQHEGPTIVSPDDGHDHFFVEEREPTGRLVLPPCIVCGLAAMDALKWACHE